jgi:nucleoside-diphosphate-sugar epimerase
MVVNVIGGSGFIGTRLCDRFRAANVEFRIFDKAPSHRFPDQVTRVDVRDYGALLQAIGDSEPMIHLAAEHRDDVRPRSLYQEVYVDGARNVCRVANARGTECIIFTSSVAVYGFAEKNTDENGRIAPFADYGRTKFAAEEIFKAWQAEAPQRRRLVIIRPTVVFGERNRGNVYNLIRQIASGRFLMIGSGKNRKSLAYVENVAAFIEYSLGLTAGVHTFNYIDKPDFSMNEFVALVKRSLGRPAKIRFRIPFFVGYVAGVGFDVLKSVFGLNSPISAIRVKKFCSDSVYSTAVDTTSFMRPVPLADALEKTVRYEFLERHDDESLFYSE